MLKNRRLLLCICALFIAAQCALGILLQIANGRAVSYFSYASVLLACLCFALFAERSHAYFLTQLALICTACADYFLVLSPVREQLPAMLFFSVTQLAYFLRIYLDTPQKKLRAVHLWVRGGASVAILFVTAWVLRDKTDAVSLVSMLYFVNLLLNIVFAFIDFQKSPLFAVGLLLFSLCDVLIGLAFLRQYFDIPEHSVIDQLIHPGFDLAWAFYVPAQTLLALSLLPKRCKGSKKHL